MVGRLTLNQEMRVRLLHPQPNIGELIMSIGVLQLKNCPSCDAEYSLVENEYSDIFSPNRRTDLKIKVHDLKELKCKTCGETCIPPQFIRENQRKIGLAFSRANKHGANIQEDYIARLLGNGSKSNVKRI